MPMEASRWRLTLMEMKLLVIVSAGTEPGSSAKQHTLLPSKMSLLRPTPWHFFLSF